MVDIIKPKSIYEYMEKNPNAASRLEAWASIVKAQEWGCPQDIVDTFGYKAVDILKKKDTKIDTKSCERVVIDVKGNNIRIIAKYQFHPKLKKARLYIKWIGSHKQYDEICKKNLQYEIDLFKK